MITIEGTLLRNAEAAIDLHMRSVVRLMVGLGPSCDPAQVTRLFGSDPAHHQAAAAWARATQRGVTVRASGTRLIHVADHAERRFVLLDLTELVVAGERVYG